MRWQGCRCPPLRCAALVEPRHRRIANADVTIAPRAGYQRRTRARPPDVGPRHPSAPRARRVCAGGETPGPSDTPPAHTPGATTLVPRTHIAQQVAKRPAASLEKLTSAADSARCTLVRQRLVDPARPAAPGRVPGYRVRGVRRRPHPHVRCRSGPADAPRFVDDGACARARGTAAPRRTRRRGAAPRSAAATVTSVLLIRQRRPHPAA